MTETVKCIKRLQAIVNKLEADGVIAPLIVAVLAEATIKPAMICRARNSRTPKSFWTA